MEWAKKNWGADGWGPKGPTMEEIMRSWDQSLLEDQPMDLVMKILLTVTMVLALVFLVILTVCCWRFRREQLAYGVQLTERVRAMMRRPAESSRRTPPPPHHYQWTHFSRRDQCQPGSWGWGGKSYLSLIHI